jgi:penicillin-binding protein 1A
VRWLLQGARGEWAVAQLPEVQGALVALDARTGAVRAMVGGFDQGRSAFNRALQAWRQPGSTLKPFIYSAALERGLMPSSVIDDAPVTIEASGGGEAWQPQNADGQFDGPMSLRRALAKSKNTVAVRLMEMIGPVPARQWLTRFGLDAERQPANLSMALGSGAATPMQLAQAYAVFANGGHRVEPQLITRITDARGRVLKQVPPLPVNESVRTLDARNAFVMDSLLGEVTRSGSARRASEALGRDDLRGKTGTTNDAFDAWFAGYQGDLVAVAWMGYDTPRKLGDHASGGGLALPVWIDFMRQALQGVPPHRSQPPDGVVQVQGEWYYEEFVPGTAAPAAVIPAAPLPVALEEERKSILDLFR